MFHHAFCIHCTDTTNTLKKKKQSIVFFQPTLYVTYFNFEIHLFNLLLNNQPFLSKDLGTAFVHVIIKVNVFVQNNIHHIL